MRLRRFDVSSEMLVSFFQPGPSFKLEIVENGLPADTEIVGADLNVNTRTLTLVLRSESFDDLREGDYPPLHPPIRCENGWPSLCM
jgi:hypothetical protein